MIETHIDVTVYTNHISLDQNIEGEHYGHLVQINRGEPFGVACTRCLYELIVRIPYDDLTTDQKLELQKYCIHMLSDEPCKESNIAQKAVKPYIGKVNTSGMRREVRENLNEAIHKEQKKNDKRKIITVDV